MTKEYNRRGAAGAIKHPSVTVRAEQFPTCPRCGQPALVDRTDGRQECDECCYVTPRKPSPFVAVGLVFIAPGADK